MTLLRSDPITGTSGVAVNTFTRKTGAGTFTYQGASALALMTPNSGSYVATNYVSNTQDAADVDVYVDFRLDTVIEGYHTLSVRGPLANTGYTPLGVWLQIQPSQTSYQIGYATSSGSTVLDYIYFVPTAGTAYTMRLRVVGTTVQCKVWAQSAGEPGGWDGTYTQTAVTAANSGQYTALSSINGGAGQSTVRWGNLNVYDAAGKPAVPDPIQAGSAYDTIRMPFGPTPDNVTMQSGTFDTNGHTWRPVVDEDFTSVPNSTNVMADYPSMGYYNGNVDTSKQGIYDPTNVLRVVNGVLTATMRTAVPSASAQANGAPSTAKPLVACVMPDGYNDVAFGRASVRFRANATVVGNGNGFKFVWFYFPLDNNWNKGEIDAFEVTNVAPGVRSRPANAIPGSGKNASGNPTTGSDVYSMSFFPGYDLFMPTDNTDWHIATVEWAPEGIYMYWDNVLIGLLDDNTSKGKIVPVNVFDFKLQMETVINQGTIDPTAQAVIEIDRVQTWELVGYGAGAYGYNGYGA